MATYQEQLERLRKRREEKERADAEREAQKLSPEQVANWRQVLLRVVGPYALIMPEAMVQEFRDRIQERVMRDSDGKS
jgi:sugar-specific transcriptional regulator TrmB